MEIARHWRLKAQRYRLEGSTCLICGKLMFPPRPVCANCTAHFMEIARKELAVVPISPILATSNPAIRTQSWKG